MDCRGGLWVADPGEARSRLMDDCLGNPYILGELSHPPEVVSGPRPHTREARALKRITVLGNFSGRNAGDNAILGNLLDDIAEVYPDLEYLIPTLNAGYVRRAFGHHRIRALGLMPWNASLKIFGLPTFYSMLKTDAVLITDNILFDRRYFNPAFNYLSTIALLAPQCKKRGIPVILYNASLGPIRTPRGAAALQRILDACPIAILRDEGSKALMERLGLRCPKIFMGADCALNTVEPPIEALDRIMERVGFGDSNRRKMAFNVNTYIDTWQRRSGGMSRDSFTKLVAGVLDRIAGEEDLDVAAIVTQVMDRGIIEEVVSNMELRDRVRICANPDLSYREIAGVLSRMELLLGMRTHSLILSCAVHTPAVNLNAYPKSEAFLETVAMHGWSVQFDELSGDTLYERVRKGWNERSVTRDKLADHVPHEQAKSKASVREVGKLLGLEAQAEAAPA